MFQTIYTVDIHNINDPYNNQFNGWLDVSVAGGDWGIFLWGDQPKEIAKSPVIGPEHGYQ